MEALEFLESKGIFNHPRLEDTNNENSYEVEELLEEYANLKIDFMISSLQLNERHKLSFEEYKNEWFVNEEGIIYLDKLTTEYVDINVIIDKYQEYCQRF